MKRRAPIQADPERVREWQQRARAASKPKRQPIGHASKEQQQKVRGTACLVCGEDRLVTPAHLIPRAQCSEGADDPRAVIALCVSCHTFLDQGKLSVLESLEPRHREELAFAVLRFGLISTLERVTNQRWAPVEDRQRAA